MDIKTFFEKFGIHLVALILFIIVGFTYFAPQRNGYAVKQHDVEQFKGMANETQYHREVEGEEPLWTNSIFGGMPTTQISMNYPGNWIKEVNNWVIRNFPIPMGAFLLHLIAFYGMALMLRIKPIIGIVGAFAFAFSSYEIIILQAGHNTKSLAVAYLPLVLGAFIYAYKRNWKWGAILSALFMAFEIACNHLQVTYYLGFLLVALGAFYMVKAIREKEIKRFGLSTIGLFAAYGLALFINYGNVSMTNDYAKHTIRGANDLTIAATGEDAENNANGLDDDYITQWSYGKKESLTLVSPYVMGSHSMPLGLSGFVEMAENGDLTPEELKGAMDVSMYWGEQPIVSGPVYLGVVVLFLALLAFVFIRDDKSIWVIAGISLLVLMLSWGKNFMGLTEFFIDNVPGYNKFRTVTIILVILELCIPVLAVLLLQKLYDNREQLKLEKKKFLIASGVFVVLLLGVKVLGGSDSYSSTMDEVRLERIRGSLTSQVSNFKPEEAQRYGIDVNNPEQIAQFVEQNMERHYIGLDGIKKVRRDMFNSSTNRTLGFGVLAIGLCALFFFTAIPSYIIVAGLGIVVLLDLVPVDRNYLGEIEDPNGNYIHWALKEEQDYPIGATDADRQIMALEIQANPELQKAVNKGEKLGKAKAEELGFSGKERHRVIDGYKFQALGAHTNYRVFDYDGGWSSSKPSYFHKSLGGYHGAKLRNIQNLFEFQISKSNNNVFNMLNVKYFIQGGSLRPNQTALGNAWAVKKVKTFDSANDEIRALGKKFKLVNEGQGQLLINGEAKKTAEIFGGEKLAYLIGPGDTLDVPISNGISMGMKAYFVSDVKGNTILLPEYTIKADTANSFTQFVSYEVTDMFIPGEEAVMLNDYAKKLSSKEYSGEATVTMTSYAPNKLVYDVDAKGKQLIVFSEIYYPEGWTAYVDGKEQDILKVNYLLRGLEVDGGKHKVEFKFDIPKYETSQNYARIGSVLLILIMLAVGFMDYRNRKNNTPAVGEPSSDEEE